MSLLDRQQEYSFSRYFNMGIEASDLATELGYTLMRKNLQLPQFSGELDRIEELPDRLEKVLPYVSLTVGSLDGSIGPRSCWSKGLTAIESPKIWNW